MRKTTAALSTFATTLLISSCILTNSNISKCWFFTHEAKSKEAKKINLTPASFLCLRKDSTYTRDFGVFDFGSWSYNGHELVLQSKNGQNARINVLLLKSNEMVADLDGQTLNFDGQELPQAGGENDPFDLQNNLWRVPAAQKENDSLIRKRLVNHCEFWEAYFTWALHSGQQTIDVRSTPTPIKIYGNGFGLKSLEDQPGRWKSYFYDEEDSRKAFNILKTMFEKNEIGFANTDNKYKMFLGAFQQVEKIIQ